MTIRPGKRRMSARKRWGRTARWAASATIPLAVIPCVMIPRPTWAAGVPGHALEEVTVTARRIGTLSETDSASVGTVFAAQLENRPILRTGELLEVVPGLIVTQH